MPITALRPLLLRVSAGLDSLLVPGMIAPPEKTLRAWVEHDAFSRIIYVPPLIVVRDDIDIGRGSQSDIVVEEQYVSRHHLAFCRRFSASWIIEDLASTNSTTLVRDGQERLIGHGERLALEHGDRYLLPGGVEFMVEKRA